MYLFNFKAFKEIDPATVNRLVVVDTRQRSRVSHVGAVLDKPGLDIHLYDHHPDTEEDLPASLSVVKSWGSTTTIILHEIMARGLTLTPDEATFLALGIYEDTGSFTFNSTTEHDFHAAAWLKGQGMDLATVSELLTRELSAEQITIMSTLIEAATTFDINGEEVTVTEASLGSYVGDFALLAHKLMDMQNIRVLFALALMKDRVHLVARSRVPGVDVGRICASLGGGGHPYAASASIKDKTLTQAKEELFALLYSQVNPRVLAETLMSRPAVTIAENRPLSEAADAMTRFGLKAMPVLGAADGACVGILEHDIVDKALKHGLGSSDAGDYMMQAARTVTPQTDLYRITEIILGQRQRQVPVVEDGKVLGVITRTDLINTLVREPARILDSVGPERKAERNLAGLLRERMPHRLHDLLRKAGTMAKAMGTRLTWWAASCATCCWGAPTWTWTWWWRATASCSRTPWRGRWAAGSSPTTSSRPPC